MCFRLNLEMQNSFDLETNDETFTITATCKITRDVTLSISILRFDDYIKLSARHTN